MDRRPQAPVDELEPVALAYEPPPITQRRRRFANPTVAKLYLLAASLGALSLLQLVAAAHVHSLNGELRKVEEAWRTVAIIDRDRAAAERAIEHTSARFGGRRQLQDDRNAVRTAARARLHALDRKLERDGLSTEPAKRLRDDVRRAIAARLANHRSAPVPPVDRVLRTWWLRPRQPDGVALTTAGETIERLSRFADEPTGLVLAGMSGTRLYVIDIDRNRVAGHDVVDGATLRSVDDVLVLVDGKLARAYASHDVGGNQLWERPANAAVTTTDLHVWLQHGNSLQRIDAGGNDAGPPVTVPDGALLVSAVESDAVVRLPRGGYAGAAPNGAVTPLDSPFVEQIEERIDAERRGFHAEASGDWLAALVDGRVVLGRTGRNAWDPALLRAPLPRLSQLVIVDRGS